MRPRLYDTLTVLGLVVLVAWAPVYLAQDPAGRALADGAEFELPPARYGDRLDLEILIQDGNGTVWTTDAVISIEYRAPGPADPDTGAVLVEELRRNPVTYVLAGMEYSSASSVVRNHYDATGRVVWWESMSEGAWRTPPHVDGLLSPTGGFEMAAESDRNTSAAQWEFATPIPLLHRPQGPFEYSPHSPLQALFRLVQPEDALPTAGDYRPPPPPPPEEANPLTQTPGATPQPFQGAEDAEPPTALPVVLPIEEPEWIWEPTTGEGDRRGLPAAYLHRDEVYYVYGPADWPADFPHGPQGVITRSPSQSFSLGFANLQGDLEPSGTETATTAIRTWNWLSADFPIPVGERRAFLDEDGQELLRFDILPARLTRGTEMVPFEQPERPVQSLGPTIRTPGVTELPQVVLGVLHLDDRPLLGNVSLLGLQSLLSATTSPMEVRQHVEDGGVIVAFAGAENEAGGTQWLLLVAGTAGSTYARVDAPAAGLASAHVDLPCRDDYEASGRFGSVIGSGPVTVIGMARIGVPCEERVEATWDLERLVVEPHGLLALARTEGAIGLETIGYTPHGVAVYPPPPTPHDPDPEPTTHKLPPMSGLGADVLTRFAAGTFEISATEHSIEDARLEASDNLAPASKEPPPMRPAMQSAAPERLHPVGPSVAYGGLALVALGLLARIASAWKTGALVPLGAALYARVHKEKALDHERRELLATIIAENPGIPLLQAARRAELHRSVAFHHLETLRRTGLARTARLGRTRHYFPPDAVDPKARLRSAAEWHPAWVSFLGIVDSNPGITLSELEARLPSRRSALSRMGSRLAQFGLVEKRQDGSNVRFYTHVPPVERQAATSTPQAPVNA